MVFTTWEVFTTRNCTGYQFTEYHTGVQIWNWAVWTRTEWMETLKTRYERQAETALPDSILITTLLSRTTGTLQQHLRMNVRLLDTYETVRNVITAYYQSRHVTGFRSLSDTGPALIEVGGVWQRKEKGKGKGRGKTPFDLLKGKGKSKGGNTGPTGSQGGNTGTTGSKGGNIGPTGKGRSRPRCWNCGQHGRVERDCRNVVALIDENEEACDNWKYCSKDWTNWTRSHTDDWSYSSDYDWTQLDWYGDSNWYDFGWNDNWTWSTGSDSIDTSVLS